MQHQRGGIRIERGWDAGKLTEEGFKIFGEEELQLNEVCVWLIWIMFELKCVCWFRIPSRCLLQTVLSIANVAFNEWTNVYHLTIIRLKQWIISIRPCLLLLMMTCQFTSKFYASG